MRSIACKACFEFGDKTFEAFVTGRNSTTACIACKAQLVCNSAKHVLIVDQFDFVTEHLLASLNVNQDIN